jgi:hypothetical protein
MKADSSMAPLDKRREIRAARHAENKALMAGFSHADFLKDAADRDAALAAGEDPDADDPDAPELTDEQKAAAAAAAAGAGWNAGAGVDASAPVKAGRRTRANT